MAEKFPLLVQLPVSERVDACWLMVPFELMTRFPDTVRFFVSVNVVETEPPTVIDFAADVALIVGWLMPVKFASPSITSVAAVGMPFVQLVAVPQLVLVVPFQLVI